MLLIGNLGIDKLVGKYCDTSTAQKIAIWLHVQTSFSVRCWKCCNHLCMQCELQQLEFYIFLFPTFEWNWFHTKPQQDLHSAKSLFQFETRNFTYTNFAKHLFANFPISVTRSCTQLDFSFVAHHVCMSTIKLETVLNCNFMLSHLQLIGWFG